MRWWKVLGMAGVVGVGASGAMTVRADRKRRAYTPEQIRSTLHERVAASRIDRPATEVHDKRVLENLE